MKISKLQVKISFTSYPDNRPLEKEMAFEFCFHDDPTSVGCCLPLEVFKARHGHLGSVTETTAHLLRNVLEREFRL